MSEEQSKLLKPGIYRLYWKEGGSSLAAVGMCQDGTRWMAPVNWCVIRSFDCAKFWKDVKRAMPIDGSL